MADAALPRNNPESLRKAATHVAHDIRMLRRAWYRHSRDPLAYTAWFVHCRSVMDFFAGVGNQPDDDVYAWHYFTDQNQWDGPRDAAPKPPKYDDYRPAVNKLAAHLTYSRVDYAARGPLPPSLEMTEYLLGLTALFHRLLPPDRAAWFGGLLL